MASVGNRGGGASVTGNSKFIFHEGRGKRQGYDKKYWLIYKRDKNESSGYEKIYNTGPNTRIFGLAATEEFLYVSSFYTNEIWVFDMKLLLLIFSI